MVLDDNIQQEAAQWFAVQRRGPMALEERMAFDAWRADPVHQAALNHVHEVWGELASVGDVVPPVRHQTPKRHHRAIVAAALVIGLTGVVAASAVWKFHEPLAVTGIGEQRSQELPDGSIVALNVVTRVRYDISSRERRVFLNEGEATFVVHKDPERPFLVQAAGYEVRAVGTAFNVRKRDHSLDVAVKEGVVEVRRLNGDGKPVLLRAGQLLQVRDTAYPTRAPIKISQISVGAVDEWRQRVLTYEDAPVDQIMRDVNRFYERPVTVDPTLGQRRVTLRLVIDDRTDTVKRLASLLNADIHPDSYEDRLKPFV